MLVVTIISAPPSDSIALDNNNMKRGEKQQRQAFLDIFNTRKKDYSNYRASRLDTSLHADASRTGFEVPRIHIHGNFSNKNGRKRIEGNREMGDAIEECKRGYFSHPPPLDRPPPSFLEMRRRPPSPSGLGICRKGLRSGPPSLVFKCGQRSGQRNCVLILREIHCWRRICRICTSVAS